MNEIKTPPEAKNLSLDDKTEKALDFLKLSYSKYGILDDGVCFQIKKVFKETGFQTTQQRLLRAIDFFQAKQITDQKRKIKITMSSLSGKWDEQTIH